MTREIGFHLREDDVYKPAVYQPQEEIIALPPGIYTANASMQYGPYFSKMEITTDGLIVSENGAYADIRNEINEFWDKEHLFNKFNVTHKRGFLLEGAPGNGKSSIINLLMQEHIANGGTCVYLYPHTLGTFRVLTSHLNNCNDGTKYLVIMEDVDEMMYNAETDLLALLDGENSIGNIVYVATTNYADKLSDRMVRPSRFDTIITVGNPDTELRFKYLKDKFGSAEESALTALAEKTNGLTFAQTKEVALLHLVFTKDIDASVERVKRININDDDDMEDG